MEAAPTRPEEVRSQRFLIFLLAVLGVASALLLWPFLTGTIFALVLGFLLKGPYKALLRVVRWKPIAAGLIMVGVTVALVAPLLFVVWRLVEDALTVVATLEDSGGVQAWVVRGLVRLGFDEPSALGVFDQAAAGFANVLQARLLPTLGVLTQIAANIGVFLFLLYFILTEGDTLARFVREAMPLPAARREHLFQTTGSRVRALFLGTFLVAAIQGVVASIGWWFFGFPAVVFWGFVMTILAVIPAVGPSVVIIPAGLYTIAQGNLFDGIGIIVYGVVVVGLVDNITRPFVVGRSSDVHPSLVLLGTLGGLSLFGITGFIIGPLILSMVGPVLAEWEDLSD